MKKVADIFIVVAVIIAIAGLVCRVMMATVSGVRPISFLEISGLCLLLSIALLLTVR